MVSDNVQRDKITTGNVQDNRAVVIGSGRVIYYEATDAAPPIQGVPPFKGLSFYDVNDAPLYFGRESLTATAVSYLRKHHFLAVIGASGSGKSSLVRAGIIAAFQQGRQLSDGVAPPPDSQQWLYLVFTPTRTPLESMAKALIDTGAINESQQQVIDALYNEECCFEGYLHHILAKQQLSTSAQAMVVVDQFEELFSYVLGVEDPNYQQRKQEQKAFIGNLLYAAQSGFVWVTITLRADFYGYCAEYENLRSELAQHQLYIGTMTREELRSAIVTPAYQGNWVFQPELVDLILDDVESQPGTLPLLSHALLETWNARSGVTMTFTGYIQTGRVQGAIAATASQVFNRLSVQQQSLAQTIFLQLIELGESSEDTRRYVHISELISSTTNVPELLETINALVQARLITVGDVEKVSHKSDQQRTNDHLQNTYVQLTHEALIREWPLLRQWLTTHRSVLLFRKRFDAALAQWLATSKDIEALLRGRFLEEAIEWQEQYSEFTGIHREEFLTASVQQWEREKEIEEQQKREQILRSRIRTILLTMIGLLLPPALFIGAQLWMFNRQNHSSWQLTSFISNTVTSIASNRTLHNQSETQLCVGTADIGVGCSTDLETWNLYQAGLPRGTPALLNDRNRWWGYLLGNVWSTKTEEILGLTFDAADSERLVALVEDGGLYEQRFEGTRWRQLSVTVPLTEVAEIAVYDDWLAILRTSSQYSRADVPGQLFLYFNHGRQFYTIGGEADRRHGIIRDIVFASNPSSSTGALFIGSEQGLFRLGVAPLAEEISRQFPNANARAAVFTLLADSDMLFWLAAPTSATDTDLETIHLYSSHFDENYTLFAVTLLGEFAMKSRPYRIAVARKNQTQCASSSCLRFWFLFPGGHMLMYEPKDGEQPLPQRPAWLPITRDLRVEPLSTSNGLRYLMMVAHNQGLIHYCPGLDDPFYLCIGDAHDNLSYGTN